MLIKLTDCVAIDPMEVIGICPIEGFDFLETAGMGNSCVKILLRGKHDCLLLPSSTKVAADQLARNIISQIAEAVK